jgi:Uma2 family endonuclease
MVVQEKRYTVAEFASITNAPENAGRLLELIDGEILEKMPTSFLPSYIALRIAYFILAYLMQNDIGYVTGADGSYVMDDENEFIPDVGYISKERLPQIPSGKTPIPPDLAVEVVSPTDSIKDVQRKARKYLRLGTSMVWIVYPEDQTVDVCLADPETPEGMRVREVGIESVLDGGDLLPGFKLAVKDIFPA